MNVYTMQRDMLAGMVKGNFKRMINYITDFPEVKGLAGIGTPYAAMFFPQDQLFLNMERCTQLTDTAKSPFFLYKQYPDAFRCYNTEKVKRLDKDHCNAVMLSNMQGGVREDHVWVDEKLLKYFDPMAEFYMTSRIKPVFVKEEGKLVGLILPLRIIENGVFV